MTSELTELAGRAKNLCDRFIYFEKKFNSFNYKLDRLFEKYQRGRYSFIEYTNKLNTLLEQKPKEYWQNKYKAVLNDIVIELDKINNQMFWIAYSSKPPHLKKIRRGHNSSNLTHLTQLKNFAEKGVTETSIPRLSAKSPETGSSRSEKTARKTLKKEPVAKKQESLDKSDLIPKLPSLSDNSLRYSRSNTKKKSSPETSIEEIKESLQSFGTDIPDKSSINSFVRLPTRIFYKFSNMLIENFPEFFNKLYIKLRQANIRIMSVSYVSLLLFSLTLAFFIGFPLLIFLFLWFSNPLYLAVSKAFIADILLMVVIAALFYIYPASEVVRRRRSIDNNLPFGIGHLEAIASAGISPSLMFKLISASKDYGELSKEFEKVNEYITFFGYDLLTAVREVMKNTPSIKLKEFFSGLISTTNAGGDIAEYLSQRAKAELNEFEIHRQKYVEAMTLYSEVYTGLMVAGPLVLIIALVLVSILGGTIAGLEINTIIFIGTYILIPLLNILFIVFLQIAQPDVK